MGPNTRPPCARHGVILSSEDFDADTAELYGLVNRSIPDAELDDFVYRLARRIASFNPAAIAMVKSYLTKRQPIPLPEIWPRRPWPRWACRRQKPGTAIIGRILAKAGAFLLTMPSSSICQDYVTWTDQLLRATKC